jgi:hypothetical protein
MANTDTILKKDNNYIFYDRSGAPRTYLPWDLDTTMARNFHVVTGTVPGGTPKFEAVLFSHWRRDYDRTIAELLSGPLRLEAIISEIDRALSVAGTTLTQDSTIADNPADAFTALKSWWQTRIPEVASQISSPP